MFLPLSQLFEKTLPHLSVHLVLLNQMNIALQTVLPKNLHSICLVANFNEETAFIVVPNAPVKNKVHQLKMRILSILKRVEPNLQNVQISVAIDFFNRPKTHTQLPQKQCKGIDKKIADCIRQNNQNKTPEYQTMWNDLLNKLEDLKKSTVN